MDIKPYPNQHFLLYEIEVDNVKALGVLALFKGMIKSDFLLPHEAVNVSYALALKKSLVNQIGNIPPCMLIADLNFSLLDWQQHSQLLHSWYDESLCSSHRIYTVNHAQVQHELQRQLIAQQQFLIADGHHRVFAASLSNASSAALPVWITAKEQTQVRSFNLHITAESAISIDALDQHFKRYGIVRTNNTELVVYTVVIVGKRYAYKVNESQWCSRIIQNKIRQALLTFSSILQVKPCNVVTVCDSRLSMFVEIKQPLIDDIFKSAQNGDYFPEKSTCFIHKPMSLKAELSYACA